MKIELKDKEAILIKFILEKQKNNTQWVVDNKDPVNRDDLEAKVSAMNKVITQIDEQVKQDVKDD